jgi:N-acetylmuramoyl-L-alanine amidase
VSAKRQQTQVKELIIHCSATPNGKPFTAQDIDRWHGERGFHRDMSLFPNHRPDLKCIGYHQVIRVDGQIEDGRHFMEVGAHCAGHNTVGIGICLIGTDQFTEAQWQSLASAVKNIQNAFRFIKILGHRDTSPDKNHNGVIEPREWTKTCPGFSVADWLAGGLRPSNSHLLKTNP